MDTQTAEKILDKNHGAMNEFEKALDQLVRDLQARVSKLEEQISEGARNVTDIETADNGRAAL